MLILGKGFWRSLFSQYHMHHMQDFLYATFLWLHMLVLRHWIFLLPNGFKLHVRLQVLFTDSQALGNCWSNFCKWSRLLSWESEGIIMPPQCHVSPRNSRPYPGIVIISPPKTSVFDWDSGQRNPSKPHAKLDTEVAPFIALRGRERCMYLSPCRQQLGDYQQHLWWMIYVKRTY